MFRKKKNVTYVEPMPKMQLRKIIKAYEAQGGAIIMNKEMDVYLSKRNCEALTYNALTIVYHTNPGRAAVFEELIHASQFRSGRNDGSYLSRIKCEIEAQEILLKNQKAYKLTAIEVLQTRKALKQYQKELLEGGNANV